MFDQVTPSSSSVFGLKVFSILTVVPRRGLQQCYNNISALILVCHVFHVEPAHQTPINSTAPPLPCESHPAQRFSISLVDD